MKAAALMILAACLSPAGAGAQALEVFAGQQRATEDVMFFRFFVTPTPASDGPARSNVLAFFRARVSTGYGTDATGSQPQFGVTTAVSYNPPAWKGLAPVAVVQVFNRGVFPKAGVQFAHTGMRSTIFTWVVSELQAAPAVDAFLLVRYVRPVTARLGVFLQGESVNALPTAARDPYSFTARARVGVQIRRWQFGPGMDVTRAGRTSFTNTLNIGGFVRHDF